MRTGEEFERFLLSEIAPRLERVEAARRAAEDARAAVSLGLTWKIAGVIAGVAIAMISRSMEALWLCAVPFAIDHYRRSRIKDATPAVARRQIIGPVIEFFDSSFQYDAQASISRGEFEASRLYAGEAFNRYAGEDFVAGRHGDTAFRFSELRVDHVSRGRKRNEVRKVFHGLFFVADFNKSFRGETWVLPDVAERTFGSFGRAFQALAGSLSSRSLVELECPEFERVFKVCSSDSLEARYLLTPSLMKRIRDFAEKSGGGLRLAFLRGKLFAAIPLPGDLFAIRTEARITLDDVRSWAGDLLFATSLVDELDLNTRIWSKGPSSPAPNVHEA